ncbi:MAG TPA: hypothetical protein VGL78_18335 [Solirubrobacteraceae bacterium]|jgi:hypothetical protein
MSSRTDINVRAESEIVPGKNWPPPNSGRERQPYTSGGAIKKSSGFGYGSRELRR